MSRLGSCLRITLRSGTLHRFTDLLHVGVELAGSMLDLINIGAFENIFDGIDPALDFRGQVGWDLVFVVTKRFLSTKGESISFVASFDLFFLLLIFFRMLFSVFEHPL